MVCNTMYVLLTLLEKKPYICILMGAIVYLLCIFIILR